MSDHFRKLENLYHLAPINDLYAPCIEISKGRAVVTMEVHPWFFHAAEALHGSVYFKALDDAAFFAAASLDEQYFVLTASFNLYFLRPVTGGTLRAEGIVTSVSKNLFIAESVLYLGEERQVARGSGSFMRSQIRLDSIESYS